MVNMTTVITANKRQPREESEDIIDRFIAAARIEFPDAAKETLADLAATLRSEYKGTAPYIRGTSMGEKAQKLDVLRTMFNGRNPHECARVLGVTTMTVRRWIKTPGKT